MSCKYNNCKHCGYKSECEIYKENTDLRVNLKWEQDTKLELAEHLGKVNDEISELEQQSEKRIAELEREISILLSCNSCPDNKGGLLCQKEYEDKCLAQKIQYIKELKEENRQLKDEVEDLSSYWNQIGKVKTEVLKAFEHIVAK